MLLTNKVTRNIFVYYMKKFCYTTTNTYLFVFWMFPLFHLGILPRTNFYTEFLTKKSLFFTNGKRFPEVWHISSRKKYIWILWFYWMLTFDSVFLTDKQKRSNIFHEIIFIGLTLQIIFEAFFQTKNAWRRRNSSMYLQIKSLLLKEIVLAKWRHFDILGVVTCPKNRCYTAHYLRFNVPLMSSWDVCQYFYASDFSKDTRTKCTLL